MRRSLARISLSTWHSRMGHLHEEALKKTPIKSKKTEENIKNCDTCIMAKMRRTPFPKGKMKRPTTVLERIHFDLVCNIKPPSKGGANYALIITDEYTNYVHAVPLKYKSDSFDEFKKFQAMAENKQGKKMKEIQTDNGGEFINTRFRVHLEECGIFHRKTVVGKSEQNGKSERQNETIFDVVRSLLFHAGLPPSFWGEALHHASHVRNLSPSAAINFRIPMELWLNRNLTEEDYSHLKVFGCQAWARVDGGKIGPRAEECIFIGYEDGVKGYKLWNIKKRYAFLSRDVKFREDIFPYKKREEQQVKEKHEELTFEEEETENEKEQEGLETDDEQVSETESEPESEPGDEDEPEPVVAEEDNNDQQHFLEDELENPEVEEVNELRRSTRERKEKLPCTAPCCMKVNLKFVEPRTIGEALECKNADKWKKAMDEEMKMMYKQDAWEVVRKPKGVNVVGSKWVYKEKTDGKESVYKARLVAQGFSQKKGVDYEETYSPVIKRKSIRLLLALAVELDWEAKHVDVMSAYLNSPISGEVYMKQPKGYEEEGKNTEDYVCKLRKSIYGLHQSGKDWNEFVDKCLKKIGLKRSYKESCIYYDKNLIVGLYVDDMIIIGRKKYIDQMLKELAKFLEFRDLGEVKRILSINVSRPNRNTIELDQVDYIHQVLSDFRVVKKSVSPLPYHSFDEFCEERVDETLYRKATGSLLYLSNATRPDLAYTVCKLSQFNSDPRKSHWNLIRHVLRYVHNTKDVKLRYVKSEKNVEAFCDSNWAEDRESRKSVSGVVLNLANAAVIWYCRKQSTVADSTMAAEYYSMHECTKDVLWIQDLLEELNLSKFVERPTEIRVDNQGAICLANHSVSSEKSRHFGTVLHHMRDEREKGRVVFKYVSTKENLADLLTKGLSGARTKILSSGIGLS